MFQTETDNGRLCLHLIFHKNLIISERFASFNLSVIYAAG